MVNKQNKKYKTAMNIMEGWMKLDEQGKHTDKM